VFSKQEIEKALKLYDELGSVAKVICQLEYPSRRTMYNWLSKRDIPPKERPPRKKINNKPLHRLHPSYEIKLDVIHRCFELGENIQLVSEEIGYSRTIIYKWRRKYIQEGAQSLMNTNDKPRGKLPEGKPPSTEEIKKLKEIVQDMQLEIDILKETLNVLKKDPGVDITALSNKEKVVIVDALRNKYSLPLLIMKLKFPRSSYYYHQKILKSKDKYAHIKNRVTELFYECSKRYGYRRIHAELKKENIFVSEKIVRRIMSEYNLVVKCKRKNKRYSSYKGEITPSVPNIIDRDFHADKPNLKWITDLSEFSIPAGKVFLSPIIDCFDGLVPAWKIGTSPDANLVNTMLDDAICTLKEGEHPLIHSDRGCHYRWSGWITRMKKADLQRSMSKKGCSPDNSACEGFFGRLKNEMFYNRSWANTTVKEFIKILNDYIVWYNEKRIKMSLGYMSPLEYRESLGIVS
jgi:transposase InsO family protein/transposase-like protein